LKLSQAIRISDIAPREARSGNKWKSFSLLEPKAGPAHELKRGGTTASDGISN
jgi:hypothetical protein